MSIIKVSPYIYNQQHFEDSVSIQQKQYCVYNTPNVSRNINKTKTRVKQRTTFPNTDNKGWGNMY